MIKAHAYWCTSLQSGTNAACNCEGRVVAPCGDDPRPTRQPVTYYADLEKRLRGLRLSFGGEWDDLAVADLCDQAADALASLTRELEEAKRRSLEWFKVAQSREPVTAEDVAWAEQTATELVLSSVASGEDA